MIIQKLPIAELLKIKIVKINENMVEQCIFITIIMAIKVEVENLQLLTFLLAISL